MKSLLILAFAGLACSTQFFSPGEEYVYNYYGRILTGIPQIDSTFAGMSLEGAVFVQTSAQNSYKMMIKNVKFGTFNDQLSGSSEEPTNWRNVHVEPTTALTAEYQQYMESPVEFILEQGQFSAVKVSSTEPQWSVNFKKALIASLMVQQPSQSSQVTKSREEEKRNPKFFMAQQQKVESVEQYYWTTMEEGIEGKCEHTYHVSELPEYMVSQYEQGMLKTELCQGKKYYQVLKTKDITKCQDRSIYISSQGHKNCLIGKCEAVNTKQSQTRYYGCGENVQSMKLHGMISEGELQHNVLAFNTETVVTGTKQILKLKEMKSSQSTFPEISSPRTCHDLSYEFPQHQGQTRQVNSRQDQRELIKEQRSNPEFPTLVPFAYLENLDIEKLKTEMIVQLQQIATEMSQVEKFAEKEITSKLKSLKTILSVMKTSDLKQMYEMIQSANYASQQYKDTARTLFIEIVRNAGTSPCVMFLKQMIENNQLTEIEKFLVVSTFTHYIKTPTEELIDQIFQLIKSNAISSKLYLKAPAHLVFGTLIRQACFKSNTKVYPEYVYGKMCSANNPKITHTYIPHLINELKSAQTETEKQVAIYALGQVGHESVLPLIISYIEGSASHSLRKAAMYSLLDVAPYYRHTLLPVYLSILHNPAESRSLRISATMAIMKMQPTTTQLQKMAVSTWFEQDFEVAKYIYSTIKSYAKLESADHPEDSFMRHLSYQCQTVLQLAKPIYHVFSVHQVNSGYLPELQIGATMINSILKGMKGTEVYHKTDYYLKQVQTTPMEFAAHVTGLNTVIKNIMKSFGKYQESNEELKDILNQLEVSPRTDAQFEGGAWLRLSDDINFAVEFNEGHINVMKEKVLRAIKDSGMKVMQKICGKHHINHNNVFEELPYTAMVPSDIGLPIVVESQMTYLVSLKGELNLECSMTKPSAQLELSKKLSYTYNGYAGTYCPFTKEMLAAGINIHRATNIPLTTKFELQPETNKLIFSLSPSSQVASDTSNIDVHHYHVKPYTTKKALVFQDMTPMVLHPQTKIIKSKASPKTFILPLGQNFGVDMELKVETECDLYDRKTMMDSWANYHYNLFAASWFSFTETALTAAGKPTARLHKYTLTHNPTKSTTKGAEMEIELSLATKEKSKQTRKMKIFSQSSSSKHDSKLETSLSKLDSKFGYAFNAHVVCKLTGSQTESYTYSITAGAGNTNTEHKWNLDLNLLEQNQKVCMSGFMKYPTTTSSQAKFEYNNYVGFGQTCQQYYVNIDGHTAVSSEQREKSSHSYESEKCEEKSQEEERLREEIQSYSEMEEEQKKMVEKKHSQAALEKLKYCSKQRSQSRTLDYTQFDITYSPQMPQYVYSGAKYTNTGLKAALYQYISYIKAETTQNNIKVKLSFNQQMNALTMTVASPEDTTQFRNIRLPSQLSGVIPFVAGKNVVEQSYKSLTGEALMAKCVVGKGYVQTFDKSTYSYQIDECDHILVSDCSGSGHHAVMAKEVNGMKHVTIFAGHNKIQVSPAQAYSNKVEQYKLTVNGEEKTLVALTQITLSNGITAYLTKDHTVIISSSSSRITHFGKTVQIEMLGSADGSHCGLCGDYNNDRRADLKSPKKCILKSSSLFGKSYRSKSSQCSPLSQKTVEEIRAEEQKCYKYETKKTSVSSIYSHGQRDSYSVKKHSYIYKEDKLCISQEPVVQCSQGSIPKSMKKKLIKFVCLPEGRVSKLYAERIERGESPQELKHQPVAFKAEMEQPVICGPAQL